MPETVSTTLLDAAAGFIVGQWQTTLTVSDSGYACVKMETDDADTLLEAGVHQVQNVRVYARVAAFTEGLPSVGDIATLTGDDNSYRIASVTKDPTGVGVVFGLEGAYE